MNDKRYRYILYLIVVVIASTILIQVYWNYKNYLNNKKQLISDVQNSLDNAVDDYYARLAERSTYGIFLEGDKQKDALAEGGEIEQLMMQFDSVKPGLDSSKVSKILKFNDIEGITVLQGKKLDSMENLLPDTTTVNSISAFKFKTDSVNQTGGETGLKNFELLTSKIVVSITNDSLDIEELDSLLNADFKRKQIGINSELRFYKSSVMRQVAKIKDSLSKTNQPRIKYDFVAISKSTFLPKGSILELHYSNETLTVLKRSISGILISTVLILAVISCLFYLLSIIKRQKQLAEVKNDLISNITHEFKTPIATIGVALESIRSFNGIDDKEKTKRYLNMSTTQLEKLTVMVEKLLETATLDSDNLELQIEPMNLIRLLQDLYHRYEIQFPSKTFHLNLNAEDLWINADMFHFENAINNILDNAVKYGGENIYINLKPKSSHIELLISDSGTTLTKANKTRIFEKFYRVPKGNTHDVKGFGIGLFYTKTIIEKLNGSIDIELSDTLTTFKIILPNG